LKQYFQGFQRWRAGKSWRESKSSGFPIVDAGAVDRVEVEDRTPTDDRNP